MEGDTSVNLECLKKLEPAVLKKSKSPHNTGTKPPGAGSARTEEQTGGPPYKPTYISAREAKEGLGDGVV